MKGKHRIIVSTKRLKYDFELRRNLTVIRGDSATGKTTLVDMIRDYVNNPYADILVRTKCGHKNSGGFAPEIITKS